MPIAFPSTARIGRNAFWLIVDRGGRLLLALLVGVYVARQLGPEYYGVLSSAQATVSLLAFLGLAAIEAIVLRMMVQEPDCEAEILGCAIALRAFGSLVLIASASALTLANGAWAVGVIPLLAAMHLFQAVDVVDYWFRLRLSSRHAAMARLTAAAVGAAIRMLAADAKDPVRTVAAAMLIESAMIAGALSLVFARQAQQRLVWQARRAKQILLEATPLIASAVAVGIYARYGYLLLAQAAGTAAVGQFAAASLAAETMHLLAVAITQSYGPVLLTLSQQDRAAFDQGIARLLRGFVAAALVIAAAVSLAAPILMPLVFGSAYAVSGTLLSWLIWSIVFVYMSVASEIWLIARGLQAYILAKTFLAALLFIPLASWLIPKWSGIGAAVATIAAYSMSAFWSNAFFRSTRPLFFAQLRALLLRPASSAT